MYLPQKKHIIQPKNAYSSAQGENPNRTHRNFSQILLTDDNIAMKTTLSKTYGVSTGRLGELSLSTTYTHKSYYYFWIVFI